MKAILLLPLVVLTAYAKPSTYVVLAPSKYRPGMDLSVSVNIVNATGPVHVTAALDGAAASGDFTEGQPGSLTIKVPTTTTGKLEVTGTGGLDFSTSAYLSASSKTSSNFIQTNKGTYKPGDTVKFRALSVHADLSIINEPMDILIFDAEGNRIKQWLAVVPDQGVVTKELRLSSQPVLGNWKIRVQKQHKFTDKEFVVAEYVLPKFDVTVEMPSYGVSTDSDVTFTVKSKYTYGKPVKGNVEVSAKLHYNYQTYETSTSAVVFTTNVPLDGQAKVTIPMQALTHISSMLEGRKLSVVANVTEGLTGNQMTGKGSVSLHDHDFKMEFAKSNPTTFKPGLMYTAALLLTRPDGQPYSNSLEEVEVTTTLTIKDSSSTTPLYPWMQEPTVSKVLPVQKLLVGLNGLVNVHIDVPLDVVSLFTTAKYKGLSTQVSLKKSHSPSNSYIQLSKVTGVTPKNGDSIIFTLKSTQPLTDFVYQILSRGTVVETKGLNANNQKIFQFGTTVTDKMAPNARIVVYYVRTDGEIVTDSISFDVSGVFKNKVSVGVSTGKAEPGDDVTVSVTSDPNSQAHLLAIDQSLLLLRSGNDITAADVSADLKEYDTVSSPAQLQQPIWWGGSVTYSGKDATEVFDSAGVKVLTDGLVYKYVDPHIWKDFHFGGGGFIGGGGFKPIMNSFASNHESVHESVHKPVSPPNVDSSPVGAQVQEPERTRSVFVETWLWSDLTVRDTGVATITTKVPDTITSWVVSAFAVNNNTGLGVAPSTAKVQVFRPFFVSLNLPYSVTRGEHLALQAIVFNYMNTDMQVRVTLAKSDNFFNIDVDAAGNEMFKQEEIVQNVLVAAGEAKSVYFPIVAADLGKMDIEVKAQSTSAADAVKRQLLVEAEGVPKEYNVPVLIDLTGSTTTFSKSVDLTLPPSVVQGSELTRVSAVGDLMGPSIAGLDSLLKMPTGCGEQTMLGLAPDVYVTDYLNSVNKLDGETADKALGFMESGYQRELTYKHTDHSFSAFGNNDPSGSMWLTAFVSRVFHQASRHIDVDQTVITRAIDWMVSKQNINGSFPEPGRVIHKNMQGKAASGTSLSLFVLISLLENKDLYTTGLQAMQFNATISKAMTYLENEVSQSDDIYVLALASYAFQLANSNSAQSVLTKLEQKAIVQEGLKHWHIPEPTKPTSNTPANWHRPNPTRAVDTEVTAYILLTYAARGDIVNGRSIMQWVAQQRNPNGGFSSTQDTVVALNALSEFAKLTFSDKFNVHIDAQLDSSPTYSFDVGAQNALVLQSQETKSIPAKVKVDASGSGMALLQVAVFFNVESEVEETTFDLRITLMEDTLNRLVIRTCTRWLGDGSASGMAVQELGIPSGFDVDSETIPSHTLLKRFEFQNKKVILYFDEINTSDLCLDFVAERTGLVAKSQATAVRVYDYYEPDNQVTSFYQSQTLKNSNVCDVCPDCDNCVNRRR